MAARIVRANYDDLAQVARIFSQHAALTERTLQDLRRQLETLRGGDWLGQGANAFYSEMDSEMLPTMGRLVQALGQAADTTRQISQIVHEAENQAAAVFKSNGTAAARTAGGAAAAAGPAGPSASAFVGPMAGPNGGGGGSGASAGNTVATAEKDILDELARIVGLNSGLKPFELYNSVMQDQGLKRQLGRLNKAGWHIQHGRSGDVAIDYHKQIITLGPKATFHSLTQAVHKIWNDPAILHNLGLDPKVIAQLRKDPVFIAELRRLAEDTNWKISLSSQPSVAHFDEAKQTIEIMAEPKRQLQSLRDSVRGAIRGRIDEYAPHPPDLYGSPWVELNVKARLTNDANELLAKFQAYHDVYNKMPPPGLYLSTLSTNQADKYAQIAGDYFDGKLRQDEAAGKLVQLMNSDPGSRADNYRMHYESMLPPGVYHPWNR
jgi:WXG100 family type VII secretion target